MVEKNTDRLWLTVGAIIVGAVMIFAYKDEVGAMAEKILSKFNVSIEDVFNDSDDAGGSELVLSDSKVSYSVPWNMMMGQYIEGMSDGSSYVTEGNTFVKKGNSYEATITVDASEFTRQDGSDGAFSFSGDIGRAMSVSLGDKDKELIDLDGGSSNLMDNGNGTYSFNEYTTYMTNESGDVNETTSGNISLTSSDQSTKTVFPVQMKDGSTTDFVINYKIKGTPVNVESFNQSYDFDLQGKLVARSAGDDSVVAPTIDLTSARKTESVENSIKYVKYEVDMDLPRKDMDFNLGSGVNITLEDASIKVNSERDFKIMEMDRNGFTFNSDRIAVNDLPVMWVHESTQNDDQLTYNILDANRNQIIQIKINPTIVD